ncbi:hypothetical protein Ccrd_015760 [Cynara cardunculus var. scolymus]|uniref:Uncharacterized protein n=1 Tax=Cynara cardunculus var. scolymus TaxID=59895 RepID=A0A103YB73_CYNCS|nr:hypothetical protein Ccrd_015760 [Cynara cardunculus var. scolymus]
MSRERSVGKEEKRSDVVETVVVAVKASKEIPKSPLVWALSHVVQPGHCVTLVIVIPSQSSGRKLWGLPRFTGDCASRHWRSYLGKNEITDSCSQMILQLHNLYDPNKLKHEQKRCMEELQCNIVTIKKSQPKVIRLNLVGSPKGPEADGQLPSSANKKSSRKLQKDKILSMFSVQGLVTPTSSPEVSTATEAGTSSVSSSDPGTSPFFIPVTNGSLKEEALARKENRDLIKSRSDFESEHLSASFSSLRFQPWRVDILTSSRQPSQHWEEGFQGYSSQVQTSKSEGFFRQFSELDRDTDVEFRGNVRDAISLSRNAPSGPPPLCSI